MNSSMKLKLGVETTTSWEQEFLDWSDSFTVEEYITKDKLGRDLLELGLEGRHAIVHSAFSQLAPVEGGPQTVVDALIEAVGPYGCLLFPTYNFSAWIKEHYWDIEETPSEMGIISETARLDPRTTRTSHPIYSHAIYSPNQDIGDYLEGSDHAFWKGSTFDTFTSNNGVLLSIGWTYDRHEEYDPNAGFTIIHYYEELSVPNPNEYWRREKWFGGVYVDWSRKASVKSYSMTVRKPGVTTRVSPAMQYLETKGIVRRAKLGRAKCQIANTREFGEGIIEICTEQPELLRVTE